MSEYDVELDAQGIPLDSPKGKAETEKVKRKRRLTEPGGARPEAGVVMPKDNRRPTRRDGPPLTPGEGDVPGSVSADAHGAQGDPATGVSGRTRASSKQSVGAQNCRRWMHHRKGEYCKECGKVGT